MTITVLFLVSLLSAGTMIYLVSYAPIVTKAVGLVFSPRLLICKLLIPFDITVTLFLVVGGILGFSQAVGGIQSLVFSTFVAAGISTGIWTMHKFVIPRWKRQYAFEKERFYQKDK
jgi:hypothetical protein